MDNNIITTPEAALQAAEHRIYSAYGGFKQAFNSALAAVGYLEQARQDEEALRLCQVAQIAHNGMQATKPLTRTISEVNRQ